MTTLTISFHAKQQEIHNHPAPRKVVAAGRRGGKSFYAIAGMILAALESTSPNGRDLRLSPVWYVAPTYGQAEDIIWQQLLDMAAPVTRSINKKKLTVELINGRRIVLKGADNEETLRGSGIGYLVMDEYADMKPHVWETVLQPACDDFAAPVLFIGTPKGKNHFYDLYLYGKNSGDDEWASFTFKSTDNPLMDKARIEKRRLTMSKAAFAQEYEASFENAGSGSFTEDMIQITPDKRLPRVGTKVMTVDLAGYAEEAKQALRKSTLNKLDEHALVVTEVGPDGWLVHEVQHGRWGVRETSVRILALAKKHGINTVGIEQGSLKNAVHPYLEDQMRRLRFYPKIIALKHGGQKKTERITWALQGRFEHGRIKFREASWNSALTGQLLDFPNPMSHDDLIDALAYTDQMQPVVYQDADDLIQDDFEPLDDISGY